MLSSYFKIALRYLAKNKIYSFINVAGLGLSLACAMLMILYTSDELSFDNFHENVNSIYQIAIDVRSPDGSSQDKLGVTSVLHGPQFKANLPEIESYVRFVRTYKDIKLGDDIQSQVVMVADSNFFTFFSFPLLRGNARTALQQPNNVVISQDVAIRYFGSEDALNKTILFGSGGELKPYTVTGVAKRPPQNSSMQFEIVLPIALFIEEDQSSFNWMNLTVNTLVKIHDGSHINAINSKMQKVFESGSKR